MREWCKPSASHSRNKRQACLGAVTKQTNRHETHPCLPVGETSAIILLRLLREREDATDDPHGDWLRGGNGQHVKRRLEKAASPSTLDPSAFGSTNDWVTTEGPSSACPKTFAVIHLASCLFDLTP